MATPKDARRITPDTISFRQVARIAGWTNKPPSLIGFEHSVCSLRFPILIAPGHRHAQLLCDSLNDRYANQPMLPRFGWLPENDFPAHKSVNFAASIRQAQTGTLHGEAATAIHSIAKEAEAVNETIADSVGPDIVSCDGAQPGRFYVFVRLFPGLAVSSPWKDWVALPDEDVDAAMLSDARNWAQENWCKVDAVFQKQSRLRMGTPPRREDEESEAVERLLAEELDRANRQMVKAKPTAETKDERSGQRKRQRGRKKADYRTVQREAELAAEWNQAREAGTFKSEFAKDNQHELKALDAKYPRQRTTATAMLDALLDRVARRKPNSD